MEEVQMARSPYKKKKFLALCVKQSGYTIVVVDLNEDV
uniref:Uncharacterized protein n=1 Tax=viral metagenome TaxID=1070528 RepID=A0A6C0K5X7_9ZZZZ